MCLSIYLHMCAGAYKEMHSYIEIFNKKDFSNILARMIFRIIVNIYWNSFCLFHFDHRKIQIKTHREGQRMLIFRSAVESFFLKIRKKIAATFCNHLTFCIHLLFSFFKMQNMILKFIYKVIFHFYLLHPLS